MSMTSGAPRPWISGILEEFRGYRHNPPFIQEALLSRPFPPCSFHTREASRAPVLIPQGGVVRRPARRQARPAPHSTPLVRGKGRAPGARKTGLWPAQIFLAIHVGPPHRALSKGGGRKYVLDDLDSFIYRCHIVVMETLESLPTDVRDWIEFLRKSLKEKSSRLSPTDLAKYTGVAFELTFTGSRREEKLANAMARGVSVREKMATEEGGSMSAEEAARFLGMAKQSALNLYHQGKLLGWRSEKQGAVRFPVWQFRDGERLPGLDQVLAKLSACGILDDWGKIGFFLQQHRLSESRRPLDLLRENKVDHVLRIAEAYVE